MVALSAGFPSYFVIVASAKLRFIFFQCKSKHVNKVSHLSNPDIYVIACLAGGTSCRYCRFEGDV